MHTMAFDIFDLAKYRYGGYLVGKAPEIDFLNTALADPEAMDIGMKEALDFLSGNHETGIWKESKNHILRLSKSEEVRRHMPEALFETSPRGEGMEAEILFSYCVGAAAAEKEDVKHIPILTRWLIDADWTGFKLAFHPSDEYLRAFAWAEGFSQEYLTRKMKDLREDLDSWQEYFDSLPQDEKIRHVSTPMFTNECWHLLEYLDFLSVLLIQNKKYGLLSERLDAYALPELQFALLSSIKNPEDIVVLFRIVSADASIGNEKKQITLRIILNYWLQNLIRIKSDYAVSLPIIGKNEKLEEIWQELHTEFEKSLPKIINAGFSEFLQMLSPKELSHWLFSIPMPDTKRENEHIKAVTVVLGMAREILLSFTLSKGFDKDMRDLPYLDAYAQNIDKIEDTAVSTQLAMAILESLLVDRHYLIGDVSDDLLSRLHSLSIAIKNGLGKDAGEIFESFVNRFRVRYEGLKSTPWSDQYEQATIESQMLMVLLYMTVLNTNDDRKKEDFKSISGYTLRQTRADELRGLEGSHYMRVLCLGELIVSQALPDLKEDFESECINVYPNFRSLLQVFNCSKGPVSPCAHHWLQSQHTNEWPVIKHRMESRQQKEEVKWIEDVYRKLVPNS